MFIKYERDTFPVEENFEDMSFNKRIGCRVKLGLSEVQHNMSCCDERNERHLLLYQHCIFMYEVDNIIIISVPTENYN